MSALYGDVVGQEAAVDRLRAAAHTPVPAYLFVGPPGCGKREAARAFAAALLAGPDASVDDRDTRLALRGAHPDVTEVERVGAAISVEMARDITRLAALAPVEGRRKVLIVDEVHLVAPAAAATLLKTIEEPTRTTVFVLLADDVTADLVTIASRCVRIDFGPVPEALVAQRLVDEGVGAEAAATAAAAAGGDLDRARLLASDPALVQRRDAWRHLPSRLDGTGATAARLVEELLAAIDAAAEPLRARQAAEAATLAAQAERHGTRAHKRELDERHRREQRRHRTDELRFGLGVLAAAYRDRLVAHGRPDDAGAVDTIVRLAAELVRNPNEALQLQALLIRLPAAG